MGAVGFAALLGYAIWRLQIVRPDSSFLVIGGSVLVGLTVILVMIMNCVNEIRDA